MKKRTQSIPIVLISGLMALIALFMLAVSNTNSWFQAEYTRKIYFDITISSVSLKVYQDTIGPNNELYKFGDSTEKFVNLSGKFIPDEEIPLVLILKNADVGAESLYLRYKIQLVNLSSGEDIPIVLNGKTDNVVGGFTEVDGWNYYQVNGKNAKFTQGVEVNLLTSFTIPYSSFVDEENNLLLNGGETVKFVLTVQTSEVESFA